MILGAVVSTIYLNEQSVQYVGHTFTIVMNAVIGIAGFCIWIIGIIKLALKDVE